MRGVTATHLEVERSKVKVTRPLNAVSKNQLIFGMMGRPTNFKLGIGLVRLPTSPTCAVKTKVRGVK